MYSIYCEDVLPPYYLPIPECGVRLVAAVTLRWQRSTDVGCSLASPSLRPRRGHFNQRTLLDNIYNLHPHLTNFNTRKYLYRYF